MSPVLWILDALFCASLLGLAWQALRTRDLFKAIVLYIVFGLMMAMAWARLDAPDVALVEAAIGAGVTGVLLLSTLGTLSAARGEGSQRGGAFASAVLVTGLVTGLVGCLVGVLAVAVWQLPVESLGLSGVVAARQEESGTSNPVTAVLLNFRAYDTLLELTVLLLAVLGAEVLAGSRAAEGGRDSVETAKGQGAAAEEDRPSASDRDPVLRGFVRLVAPVMVVVAGYVLWIGGEAPGGAFPSGAVLAAMCLLLMLSRAEVGPWFSRSSGRWILVTGLIVFWGVGIAMLAAERRFLEYPVPGAKGLVLLIESVAAVSIAATLVALYRGGRLVRRRRRNLDSEFRL